MNLGDNDFFHVDCNDGRANSRTVHLNLFCGYKLEYDQELEGGGIDQRRDFLYAIRKAGKPTYNHGLEWCAGPGIIGFELLGLDIVQKISFMDLYRPAIDSLHDNAKRNTLEDKIKVYHADKIANINNSEKFDLVVGNPPHAFDYDAYVVSQVSYSRPTINDIPNFDNLVRIDVDKNMAAHIEFFDNIRDKITDDADLFISEMGDVNMVLRLVKERGYEVIAQWYMRSMEHASGSILHLRPKKSGFVI